MPSCELCGREVDSVKKSKIEGAVLKVCDSCGEMGEDVSTSSRKKKKKKQKRSKSKGSNQVLVSNFGRKIKQAREEEQLSLQELSDELNEKKSLLSKIEGEELKPDKSLAQKLGKRFSLTLYTNPEVADYGEQETDSRKARMEDVADIKE